MEEFSEDNDSNSISGEASDVDLDLDPLTVGSEENSRSDSETETNPYEQADDENDQQADLFEQLQGAIQYNTSQKVKKLLERISSLDEDIDEDGKRLLHLAAERGDVEIFQMIQKACSNLTNEIVAKDTHHNTVLSISLLECHWDLCEHLHATLNVGNLANLYKKLANHKRRNRMLINLIDGNRYQLLANLFDYNYSLAKDAAADDGLDAEYRARLYYLLSQWLI